MVKHHSVIGKYVTIEVDDWEYKVFYLHKWKRNTLNLSAYSWLS